MDIETPILKEIKALQKKEGLPMGKIISRLLADALDRRGKEDPAPELKWITRRMNPLVDLADKEAVYGALDRGET